MKKQTLIVIATMISTNIFAQTNSDIKGTKDYPLVSRFEGSIIKYYKETKWDSYKLPVFKNDITKPNYEKPLVLEGKIMRWQYSASADNNPAYIMKNYEKAFKNSGYKILLKGKPGEDFKMNQAGFYGEFYGDWEKLKLEKFGFKFEPIGNHIAIIVAKAHKNKNNIYIVEVISDFSNTTMITQDVIEVEAAETGLVTSKNMADDIAANGHIAIYDIHFDPGKSKIKSDSANALKNIAEYLNAHSDKQFFIVGHAAGIGDFKKGMKLSELRAKAVKNELVLKYSVHKIQLEAYGVGALCPRASNNSEAGRAKNRRVEIVEQ